MSILFRTTITGIGEGVRELLDGGVLILFAEGAPPELAEMSVLHAIKEPPSPQAPQVGADIRIGGIGAKLTAVGDLAWAKVTDMGHIVINFNDSAIADRRGELCASKVDPEALTTALTPGAEIVISE
jgi:PTS system glucitol/sorbitol-specific IIA component